MEIISTPATVDETVTDLDIGFTSGLVKSFVIHPGDKFKTGATEIIIMTRKPAETIVINRAHVAWHGTQERVVSHPVNSTKTGATPTPPQ